MQLETTLLYIHVDTEKAFLGVYTICLLYPAEEVGSICTRIQNSIYVPLHNDVMAPWRGHGSMESQWRSTSLSRFGVELVTLESVYRRCHCGF